MKLTVRRTQERVIKVTTLPVELDSVDFPEFKGKTEKAFLEYLSNNFKEIINDDSYYEHPVHLLVEGPNQVYYDSSTLQYTGSLESGEIDEANQENGWFNTNKQIKLEIK
jgi:hypothetical protein